MQHLRYDKTEYHRPGSALGLIVLQSDETLEDELRRWLPDDVALFHTRVPNSTTVTSETLAEMEAEIPRAASLLPLHAGIGTVAYACTSGATVIGEAAVEAAVQRAMPGVAVTNPLTAVKARLRSYGASRVGLLTPYLPEVSQAIIANLEADGFEITSSGSFFEMEDPNVARISPESVIEAMVEVGSGGEVDAVFASCTSLRTFGVLDEVERRLGKPATSSNSALLWHMLELRTQRLTNSMVDVETSL